MARPPIPADNRSQPHPPEATDADDSHAAIQIYLLGGFRVQIGAHTIADADWRLRKAASVVKLLALTPGYRLSREQVLDLLWPDLDLAAAANNLHYALHVGRRILNAPQPGLIALPLRRDVLSLQPSVAIWTDVAAFEAAASAARRRQEPAALQGAIARYTGDLLPEDRYEDWASGRREALRETVLGLLLDLARCYEERETYASAIELLEQVVAHEPTREEAHAGLMRLLATTGRRNRALHQYTVLRETLRRELAVEPDTATQRLYGQILAGRFARAEGGGRRAEEGVLAVEAPRRSPSTRPPAALPPPPSNLPVPLTSFVGREEAVAEVRRRLAGTHLLTLTGPGGCGKTRLALAVATALVEDYPAGVWLVELAAVADPALLPGAVAQAVGVPEEPQRPLSATLVEALRPRRLLLVLDNCEHLIDACAHLAEAILRACPQVQVIATSRAPLHIPGELVWPIPSLAIPADRPDRATAPDLGQLLQVAAVRLFCDRAAFVQPTFTLTAANAGAVAEICRRLDGIPLAIELAAARVPALAVEQLAARLDDALRLLTTGNRTAVPRQQTLRATLDWGYALLEEHERAALRRLAVFAGGWSLEAAEAICGELQIENGTVRKSFDRERVSVFDILASLVDKSLVQVQERAGEARYRLLETVRQYAWERLVASGEAEALRFQHAAFFLALAEQAGPELRGPRQAEWLDRLEHELDNLRAVLGWALDGTEVELGLRLAGSLDRFWQYHAHLSEGRTWLGRGLAAGDATSPAVRAKALGLAGWLTRFQDDLVRATTLLDQGLALYQTLGDRRGIADTLDTLGDLAYFAGDYPRAIALHEENLALRRTLGDDWAVAMSLNSLGCALHPGGDTTRALSALAEGLALARALGDRRGTAILLNSLAHVLLDEGDYHQAAMMLREGLAMFQTLGNKVDIAGGLEGLAAIAGAQGRALRSARLFGAAAALRDVIAVPISPIIQGRHYARHLATARGKQGTAAFDTAWMVGRALALDHAIAEALADGPATPGETAASAESARPPLSLREREVAALIARHRTNHQIATTLGIAERTVDAHVRTLLRKSGCTSRAEITAWLLTRDR